MCNKYIQVLWVENDPKVTSAYPNEAAMVADLELHPFPCWEEAEAELERNYELWDAIILDAKCKYRKNDADLAEKFIPHVIPRIMNLATRKKRTIPWYVLTGEGENSEVIWNGISDLNEWDEDWFKLTGRRFYSKIDKVTFGGTQKNERYVLFNRIKTQVTHYRHEMHIEHNLYPDIFSALDRLDLAGKAGYYLMSLLEPIHFDGTSNTDYNRRYLDLRKSLEHIFSDMVKMGLLPPIIIGKNKKKNVNLSWSSLFLGGAQPEDITVLPDSEKRFWEKVTRNTENPILPKQLSQWLKSAVFQTGGAAHAPTEEEEIAMNLENYLPHVDGSPYMLRSLVMGLCDFILWYDNFLKSQTHGEKLWELKEVEN